MKALFLPLMVQVTKPQQRQPIHRAPVNTSRTTAPVTQQEGDGNGLIIYGCWSARLNCCWIWAMVIPTSPYWGMWIFSSDHTY